MRHWSADLNAGDNEGAASLFARNATVIQGENVYTLRSHAEAVEWNTSLPCAGQIVSITTRGETTVATFVLADRQQSRCDGPGGTATALVRVHHGRIVLWHQTASAPAPPEGGEA